MTGQCRMTHEGYDVGVTANAFSWGTATDVGRVRARNEDAFLVDEQIGLFGVVDGMGGHPGGDVAAGTIAEAFPNEVSRKFTTMRTRQARAIRRWLESLVVQQSLQLCFQGLSRPGYAGMGATLAVLLGIGGRAYMANLGDSRIYCLRTQRLSQLSRDHSVIAELLDAGEIRPQDVATHGARGLLTQYVGMPEEPKPYVRSRVLHAGDRFLLCTDGLTNMVSEPAIARILGLHAEPRQAAEALVEAANDAGGMDNTTVVVADWQR